MTAPIPILGRVKSRTSRNNNMTSSPERMVMGGRGGAGNCRTPAEVKAADEEECRITAELANSHPSQSTSSVKDRRSDRRASLFSLHSLSSRSTASSTSSATMSFLERFGISRRPGRAAEEGSMESNSPSKSPSETPSSASIAEE
ncbi:hypothetical protein CERZMDRAFT_97522 [Cercospora zeae-maydis SCOH1-5]|uniref:Uncharacterized protein n=1 Tax=Cercospora zeae-maydis SCOH1-5 TaxID=717836 RepID=A0A6A6FFT5_9PEZI|nr:hypothetical protein CERZMDRAFT_97522 [Cercospora zeae-maydis SCOH1-5]